MLESREFRAPIPLWDSRGYVHYPLNHYERPCTYVDTWAGAWNRIASRAFPCELTTSKVPLSQLFFGRSTFKLREIFADNRAEIRGNPLVGISTIRPLIDYEEKGAIWGITAAQRYNDCIRVGVRGRLPARFITVRQNATESELQRVPSAQNLFCTKNERYPVPGTDSLSNEVKNVFAGRLDFLSSLFDSSGERLVIYHDAQGRVSIAKRDATNGNTNTNPHGLGLPGAKVHLIGSPSGRLPKGNFGQLDVIVNTLPLLPADGRGIDTTRAVFDKNTNYTPLALDADAQSKLYLVPTIRSSTNPEDFNLTPDARVIETQIESIIDKCNNQPEAIEDADTSVINFLAKRGVSFDTQHIEGLGDFNTEIFIGYDYSDCVWFENHLGIVFPSGKKIFDPRKLLAVPLGNNGHFEVRLGTEVGIEAFEWLKIRADSMYSFVLKRRETIPAPFRGATVQNIGPCVDAEISWAWYWGHLDFTFLPTCLPCFGFDLGYEVYAKRHDEVRLLQRTARDFGGVVRPLVSCADERCTTRIAHRVRSEFFYQVDYANFFVGFANTFAGKNVPQETDWYLGVTVTF